MGRPARLWKLADLFEVIEDLDARVKAIEKDLYPSKESKGGKDVIIGGVDKEGF